VQVTKSKIGDHTLLLLANGKEVEVNPPYQEVSDSIERLVEDYMEGGAE
jgi:hypothetical protein